MLAFLSIWDTMAIMGTKGMGEAEGFSLDVINEVQRAITESGMTKSEVHERAGMSQAYFYKRMRGEAPFNTNDIGRLADVLDMDAFIILRRAANAQEPRGAVESALANIYNLAAKRGDTEREQEAFEELP